MVMAAPFQTGSLSLTGRWAFTNRSVVSRQLFSPYPISFYAAHRPILECSTIACSPRQQHYATQHQQRAGGAARADLFVQHQFGGDRLQDEADRKSIVQRQSVYIG